MVLTEQRGDAQAHISSAGDGNANVFLSFFHKTICFFIWQRI
jgi:hypothetical protein